MIPVLCAVILYFLRFSLSLFFKVINDRSSRSRDMIELTGRHIHIEGFYGLIHTIRLAVWKRLSFWRMKTAADSTVSVNGAIDAATLPAINSNTYSRIRTVHNLVSCGWVLCPIQNAPPTTIGFVRILSPLD